MTESLAEMILPFLLVALGTAMLVRQVQLIAERNEFVAKCSQVGEMEKCEILFEEQNP